MPTPEGVWTEYQIDNLIDDATADYATILRTFSSEIAALRSATENGNRAKFVRFGETIGEALARKDDAPKPEPRASRTTRRSSVKDGVVAPDDVLPAKADA